MNICLIYPANPKARWKRYDVKNFWPPLGLCYIASYLKRHGHEVRIIDREQILYQHDYDLDRADQSTLKLVSELSPNYIGLSVTAPLVEDTIYTSELIHSRYSHIPIVVGGPQVTAWPELVMSVAKTVDIAVIGEGEMPILDLASGARLEDISGIIYRENGGLKYNPKRIPTKDIDIFPHPDRRMVDMDFYSRPGFYVIRGRFMRATSIFSSRGCAFRCTFCVSPNVFGPGIRFHSPEYVIEEIEDILSHSDIKGLYFCDDNFLSDKKRAYEICCLMIKTKLHKRLRWAVQARVDRVDLDILKLMKSSGCIHIDYGFESGSQRVLDHMGKYIRVEDSLRAARLTRQAGIKFCAFIVTGMPGETREEFEETVSFLRKIRANYVDLFKLIPIPGSKLYNELVKKGLLNPEETIGYLRSLDFTNLTDLNLTEMDAETFNLLFEKVRTTIALPTNSINYIRNNWWNSPETVLPHLRFVEENIINILQLNKPFHNQGLTWILYLWKPLLRIFELIVNYRLKFLKING